MKKIEVVVDDGDLNSVLKAIYSAARVTALGGGRIFVYDVQQSRHIGPNGEEVVYEEETFDVDKFLKSQNR